MNFIPAEPTRASASARHRLLQVAAFVAAGFLALPGCSRLVHHPKGIVAAPAGFGGTVGVIAGSPVALVMYPITGPIAANVNPKSVWAECPLWPMSFTSSLLGTALGTPSWLIAGWWGLPPGADPIYATPWVLIDPWCALQPNESWRLEGEPSFRWSYLPKYTPAPEWTPSDATPTPDATPSPQPTPQP